MAARRRAMEARWRALGEEVGAGLVALEEKARGVPREFLPRGVATPVLRSLMEPSGVATPPRVRSPSIEVLGNEGPRSFA